MKEYEGNHRPARRTRLWQAGVTEKKYLCLRQGFSRQVCVLKKKHKRKKLRIMTAQRNLNKLIQRKQKGERILGNTFPKRISIRAFSLEKLGEMLEIGTHLSSQREREVNVL
jgi:hypothetical protein